MFCRNCGKEINETDNFCSSCGFSNSKEATVEKKSIANKISNYLELIQTNIYLNKYDMVEKYANEILEICPDIPLMWAILGTCLVLKEDAKKEWALLNFLEAIKLYLCAVEYSKKNNGETVLTIEEDSYTFKNSNLFDFMEQSFEEIEKLIIEEHRNFYFENFTISIAESIEDLNNSYINAVSGEYLKTLYKDFFSEKGEQMFNDFIKKYLNIIENLCKKIQETDNRIEELDFSDYITLCSVCHYSIETLCLLLENNNFEDKEFLIHFYKLGIEILKLKISAKGWDYEYDDYGEKEWFISTTLTDKAISLNNQEMQKFYLKIQNLKMKD